MFLNIWIKYIIFFVIISLFDVINTIHYIYPSNGAIGERVVLNNTREMCALKANGLYNLETVIGPRRISLPFMAYIFVTSTEARMVIEQLTVINQTDSTYYAVLSTDNYDNFHFIRSILNASYFIDLNLNVHNLKYICDAVDYMGDITYGHIDLDYTQLRCLDFSKLHLKREEQGDLYKIRIYHDFGENRIKVYQFLKDGAIIENVITVPGIKRLVRLVLGNTNRANITAYIAEHLWVILEQCGKTESMEHDEMRWRFGRRVYHAANSLCETVREPGFYNILIKGDNGQEKKLNNLGLTLSQTSNGSESWSIYANYQANFTLVSDPTTDIMDLFNSSWKSLREFLRSRHLLKMNPNSSQYTDRFSVFSCPEMHHIVCTLQLINKRNGYRETINLEWDKSYQITQQIDGVNMTIISELSPQHKDISWYEQSFVRRISCTKEAGTQKVVCVSDGANLVLKRHLINCCDT